MYLVLDCAFNREYYPSYVGKRMDNPPSNAMAVPCRRS